MALRLIEMFLPREESRQATELLQEGEVCNCLGFWEHEISENQSIVWVLIQAEETETVLDLFDKRFSSTDGFKIILLPVEAVLPRPEDTEEDDSPPAEKAEETSQANVGRISREELYADVTENAKLSRTYLILVALSSVVAAIGLVRDDVAVVIGAMVIAPLLGPNVAMALATTLGDLKLVRSALVVSLAGICIALLVSIGIGTILDVSPAVAQIASRTRVGLGDVALALASGGAGALSFTIGISAALVGVMVAVALLPPLVVFGMLLGTGYWTEALGALLLTLTNLICVNLAGTVAFVAQGVRPTTWWERDQATKATRTAILLWLLLLAALVLAIGISK